MRYLAFYEQSADVPGGILRASEHDVFAHNRDGARCVRTDADLPWEESFHGYSELWLLSGEESHDSSSVFGALNLYRPNSMASIEAFIRAVSSTCEWVAFPWGPERDLSAFALLSRDPRFIERVSQALRKDPFRTLEFPEQLESVISAVLLREDIYYRGHRVWHVYNCAASHPYILSPDYGEDEPISWEDANFELLRTMRVPPQDAPIAIYEPKDVRSVVNMLSTGFNDSLAMVSRDSNLELIPEFMQRVASRCDYASLSFYSTVGEWIYILDRGDEHQRYSLLVAAKPGDGRLIEVLNAGPFDKRRPARFDLAGLVGCF